MWVKSAPDGSGEAYCKLCHCNLNPKMCSLQNHEKSEKHKKKTVSPVLTPPINFQSTAPNDVKHAELELAVAICCHCSTS